MKATFIDEMADLCEKVGADVRNIARGVGLDSSRAQVPTRRIGVRRLLL
jgi:UDP-glucose 6-dehydrogenase